MERILVEVWVMYLLVHVFSSQCICFLWVYPCTNSFRHPFPGYIPSVHCTEEKLSFAVSDDCS